MIWFLFWFLFLVLSKERIMKIVWPESTAQYQMGHMWCVERKSKSLSRWCEFFEYLEMCCITCTNVVALPKQRSTHILVMCVHKLKGNVIFSFFFFFFFSIVLCTYGWHRAHMTITTNLLKKNLYLLPIFGFEVGINRATCEPELYISNYINSLSEFFINLANFKNNTFEMPFDA